MDQISFTNLALSDEIKHAVADMGYDDATSIQSLSIPLILEGKDVIGRSETGSGKTAAFGLPAIECIDCTINPRTTQVLILLPTRELAVQACTELRKFAKYKNDINIVPIYGGEPIVKQMERLKQGCQIVVGTPGRVMDHMRRKTLKLSNVRMVVLDEADEMLNMGFIEDIETILSDMPQERQTILFSATMPPEVLEITKKFQTNPVTVEIKQTQLTVSTIEQYYFAVTKGRKNFALVNLLEYYDPTSCIIFCNTKKMVDELIKELRKHGFPAQGLHGDMRQASRSLVMNQFKNEKFTILVATDVAARGIDVNDVKIVINYDLPQEDEYYVHRIGRTGRAGKTGMAFSLVQGNRQLSQLMNIMRYAKCEITLKQLPSTEEIRKMKVEEFNGKILSYIEANDSSVYKSAIEKLVGEKYNIEDIAAALFAMSMKPIPVMEDIAENLVEQNFEEREESHRRIRKDRPGSKTTERSGDIKKRDGSVPFKRTEHCDENMITVKLSIGKKEKISPNHILGAVAGETELPGKIFGNINIQNTFSTIDVPKEHIGRILECMNRSKIKGKKITADVHFR